MQRKEFKSNVAPGYARLLVNPESGTKSVEVKQRKAEAAAQRLRRRGWQVDSPIFTQARGHATKLAKDAVRDGVTALFVVGGDGTAQEVLEPLAGTETALGMIAAGGQNLWTKEMGIPRDPTRAIDVQLRRGIRDMNVATLNGHPFRLLAGVNFDAAVINAAHRPVDASGRRSAKSPLEYARLANQLYAETSEVMTTVHIDGINTAEVPVFLGWIGNTRLLSNSFLPFVVWPDAQIDDNQMEVTLLPRVSRAALARATVPAGIRHTLHRKGGELPFGTYRRGRTITFHTESPVHAHVDGSPTGEDPTQEFTVVTSPKALKVFAA